MSVIKAALAILLLALAASAQTIQLEDGAFRVSGWKPSPAPGQDFSSIFAVYAGGPGSPSMLGTYAVENGALVFRPRFPLAAGIRYRAVFQPAGSTPVETFFDGPKKDTTPSTRIVHIYPSTNVLPDNQLKLYIQFSAPMSRGEAWKRIHILDENGKAIDLPFVEIEQELWDPSYQRLTVLFDPGRIKRGLVPNQDVGPPIVEGKQYTLVIDRDFLDGRGVPLVEGSRKPFRGGPSDRTAIDPKKWKLNQPKAGTSEALVVDFPEPLDFALLERLLSVPGVQGTVSIDRDETQWRFVPVQPWKAGEYQLVVDIALEDLAGNRIDRVFDVDRFETPTETITTKTISLPFSIVR